MVPEPDMAVSDTAVSDTAVSDTAVRLRGLFHYEFIKSPLHLRRRPVRPQASDVI